MEFYSVSCKTGMTGTLINEILLGVDSGSAFMMPSQNIFPTGIFVLMVFLSKNIYFYLWLSQQNIYFY